MNVCKLKCKLKYIMQQESRQKHDALLLNKQSYELQEIKLFPNINIEPHKNLPEIFQLGGNKKLNETLYLSRSAKLQMINLTSIIQIDHLSKSYKLDAQEEVVAIKEITLKDNNANGAIKEGEFIIIRGPSGGGKTTFLNLLGTIDTPTSGTIWIDGHLITNENDDEANSILRRDKIGIVFQTFNLLALMTAFENIELPMRIKGELSEHEMKKRTKMLLKKVGLLERADHLPSQLSGGQQQRVAIARSLANSPSIILLDEPTGDLDSKSTVQIMNLLLEINNFGYENNEKGQKKITIIMVTHNEDLQVYGDRIIFFQDGKIKNQVLNQYQFALNPQQYSNFLNNKI